MRALTRLCELYPGICLSTEEKARKTLSQGSRRVPVSTMKTEYTDVPGQLTGPVFLFADISKPICCPETSVRNYHYTLRNSPEERGSHLLRGGSLKSRITTLYIITSTAPLERSVKQEGIEGSHVAYVCRKALVAHLLLCNFCVKCTASRLLTFKKACSLTLRKESPCTQQSSVNTRKDPVPTQNNFLVCRVDIL